MTTHFFLKSVFNQFCGNLSLIDFFVSGGFYYFTFHDVDDHFSKEFYFALFSYEWFKPFWVFYPKEPNSFSLAVPISYFNSLDAFQFARYLKNNSSPF